MILLDLVDFILYFGYAMVVSAAVLAIGFPLWIASKNPKSLIETGIGLGSILVLFLIAWLIYFVIQSILKLQVKNCLN